MANSQDLLRGAKNTDVSSAASELSESSINTSAVGHGNASTADGQASDQGSISKSGRALTYIPLETNARRSTAASDDTFGPRLVRTVPEAASLLGVSRALGYKLVREGLLRHIRLGRRIVVPYKAIQELLDGPRSDPQ
jgi:excisionase family DNA binding protein